MTKYDQATIREERQGMRAAIMVIGEEADDLKELEHHVIRLKVDLHNIRFEKRRLMIEQLISDIISGEGDGSIDARMMKKLRKLNEKLLDIEAAVEDVKYAIFHVRNEEQR